MINYTGSGAGHGECNRNNLTVMTTTTDEPDCTEVVSPGGTRYYIPGCTMSQKPKLGQQFATFEAAINFYNEYARAMGFDTRRCTVRRDRRGEIYERNVLCSRAGFPDEDNEGEKGPKENGDTRKRKQKRRVSNRVGCKARVIIKCINRRIVFHLFEERHTHDMCSDRARPFMKLNRLLQPSHQHFIATCAKANIGPVKSYQLYKEMVGGYENIGATTVDFRNFKRDLQAYISGGDAQLVIENFFKKQEANPEYSFEYDVDDHGKLTRMFWADPEGRKNFKVFGDIVSFDATYRTNR